MTNLQISDRSVVRDNDKHRILKTDNYSLFSFYETNRPADHFMKIVESIKKRDLSRYNPIMVDLEYNIIDGQNRFLALKYLKKPIYYVVIADGNDNDISALNVNQKNWTSEDYLNYYSSKQYGEYLFIKSILDQTDKKYLSTLIRLTWTISGSDRKSYVLEEFKTGRLRINREKAAKFIKVIKLYDQICDFIFPCPSTSAIRAIFSFYEKITPEKFIHQMKKYSCISKGAVNQSATTLEFERIYNYRSRNPISLKY